MAPQNQQAQQQAQLPLPPAFSHLNLGDVSRLASLFPGPMRNAPQMPATTPSTTGPDYANDPFVQAELAKEQALGQGMQQGLQQLKQLYPLQTAQIAQTGNDVSALKNMPVPVFGPQWASERAAEGRPVAHPLLHNILTGLARFGMSTGPGQAIGGMIYGPEIARYRTRMAQQLEAIKQEQGEQQATAGAAASPTQLGSHLAYSSAVAPRGTADIMRAEAYGMNVGGENYNRIAQAALDYQKNNITAANDQLRGALENIRNQVQAQGNQQKLESTEIDAQMRGAVANVMAQMLAQKMPITTAIIDMINGVFPGTFAAPRNPTAAAPLLPPARGHSQPAQNPAPKAGKPSKFSGPPRGSIIAVGPNGHRIYSTDGQRTWYDAATGKPIGR